MYSPDWSCTDFVHCLTSYDLTPFYFVSVSAQHSTYNLNISMVFSVICQIRNSRKYCNYCLFVSCICTTNTVS